MPENRSADCLILLDDVPLHNTIADKMLGHHNMRMPRQLFTSAHDLLAFLRQPLPALPERMVLLVDLLMPEMSGLEFADHFSELPAAVCSRCRLFIVSSTLDERDLTAIEAHNAIEHFLNKPLDPEKLLAALDGPVPAGKWGE